MKKWHTTSSESGKCFHCKKTTGTYCGLTENEVKIKIPVCDSHYNLIDKNKFKLAMQLIRQELLHVKE